MQRVLYILFILFALLNTNLFASSIQNIIFSPAITTYYIDGKKDIFTTKSNSFSLQTERYIDKNSSKKAVDELSFYKYDPDSNNYIKVNNTLFLKKTHSNKKIFNPSMTLKLNNGDKIDISKMIPAIKCLIFKENEPLIVIYKNPNEKRVTNKIVTIYTKDDKEVIKIKNSSKNRELFVGFINTTTKCKREYDGKLYAKDGMKIDAYINNKTRTVKKIFTFAMISNKNIQTKGENNQTTSTPKKPNLQISIKADKNFYSSGDFITYQIIIENNSNKDLKDIILYDKTVGDIRYKRDSFEIDSNKIKDILFDTTDKTFQYKLNLKKDQKKVLSFIGEVGINSGKNIKNIAFIKYKNWSFTQVISTVNIKNLQKDSAMIVGRVEVEDKDISNSLSGIRFYLDNGKFTTTDENGKFNFHNLSHGSHVISIDPTSIEGRFEISSKNKSVKNLGSKISQFIEIKDSGIRQIIFYLKIDKNKKVLNPKLNYDLDDLNSAKMENFNLNSFKKFHKNNIFLWPPKSYVPSMPSVKVAFLHKQNEKMVLFLNNKKVDLLNYDGFVKSKDKKRVIDKYIGIDIEKGDNILEAKLFSKNKKLIKTIKRKIHLSTSPVKAKIIKEKSRLIADGKTLPIIAIQLFDSSGYPIREGMTGKFLLEKPYICINNLDISKQNPFKKMKNQYNFVTKANGIAYIKLEPTTISGEVKLHFDFQNQDTYTKTWLIPSKRKWLIVGFAKGSIGYKILKKSIKKSKHKNIYKNGSFSFFAKGSIDKNTLLSIAYNSGKRLSSKTIKEINPSTKYTIYGDNSLQHNEAISSDKLYLKIEKSRFYALFGDFNSGFNTHQLSRYNRVLHGVKSEYKSNKIKYNLFVSQDDSTYKYKELIPDGTSGPYKLLDKNIKQNSLTLYIKIIDRYQDNIVISQHALNPVFDYSIDYDNSSIYFKEPIRRYDNNFNRRVIVAEYEVKDRDSYNNKRISYGGKIQKKFLKDRLEIGSTILKIRDNKRNLNSLYSIFSSLKIFKNSNLNAEYAKDDKNSSAVNIEFKNYSKNMINKISFRNVDDKFGINENINPLNGKIEFNLNSQINYSRYLTLNLSLNREKIKIDNSKKSSFETKLTYNKKSINSSVGYRVYKSDKIKNRKTQLISTFGKRFLHNRLKLSSAFDYSLNGKSDIFSDRFFLEASYNIYKSVDLFAKYEISDSKNSKNRETSLGFKSLLFKSTTLRSSISKDLSSDNSRVFGFTGLKQSWQINKNLSLNGSIEKQKTIKGAKQDYTSYSISTNYLYKNWIFNSQIEYKKESLDKKTNYLFSFYKDINDNLTTVFKYRKNKTKKENFKQDKHSAKLSLAYRPRKKLLFLNTTKYEQDDQTKKITILNKAIYNLNAKTKFSSSYELNYHDKKITSDKLNSLVDNIAFDFTYDLTQKIDIGFNLSILHSYQNREFIKNYGFYTGYNLFKNSYLNIGYNFNNFNQNITFLQNREQGIYLGFVLKYDQESLKEIVKSL